MNKLLLCLAAAATAAAAQEFTRDQSRPFRKLGTNYYDLRPLFAWYRLPPDKMASKPNPLPEWRVCLVALSEQVIAEGVVFKEVDPRYPQIDSWRGGPYLATNVPNFKSLRPGRSFELLAVRTGKFSYTRSNGQTFQIEIFDRGVPFDPNALAKQKGK